MLVYGLTWSGPFVVSMAFYFISPPFILSGKPERHNYTHKCSHHVQNESAPYTHSFLYEYKPRCERSWEHKPTKHEAGQARRKGRLSFLLPCWSHVCYLYLLEWIFLQCPFQSTALCRNRSNPWFWPQDKTKNRTYVVSGKRLVHQFRSPRSTKKHNTKTQCNENIKNER